MVVDQHDRWCGKKNVGWCWTNILDGGIATYGMTCGIVLDICRMVLDQDVITPGMTQILCGVGLRCWMVDQHLVW